MTESKFSRVTDAEITLWEQSWQSCDIAPVPAMEDVLAALRAAYEEIDRLNTDYGLLSADYDAIVEASGRWQERADIQTAVIRQQADQLRGLQAQLEERGGIIKMQSETLQAMQAALGPETRQKIADFKKQFIEGRI